MPLDIQYCNLPPTLRFINPWSGQVKVLERYSYVIISSVSIAGVIYVRPLTVSTVPRADPVTPSRVKCRMQGTDSGVALSTRRKALQQGILTSIDLF